ncbi:MAG: hypothetical protein P8Y64_03150 [Gammaproteobacteria bacterium]|jgi:hypothetical protein
MKTRNATFKTRLPWVAKAAVVALFAAPLVVGHVSGIDFSLISTVQAAESSGHGYMGGRNADQGGQQGQKGGHEATTSPSSDVGTVLEEDEGEEGEGGKGAMGGSRHDQGQYDNNKMQGGGSGGPGEDSDAKGPRYSGGQGDAEHGGKPAWAQEGIPEVELGRLNVARAPSKVMDRSLAEALAALAASPELYQLDNLQAVNEAILADTYVRIDSPLENLALYKDLLADGQIVLPDGTVFTTSLSTKDLLAIFLGGASDKTVEITSQTVEAIDTILDVSLPSGVTEESLAQAADSVREAILEEHGE